MQLESKKEIEENIMRDIQREKENLKRALNSCDEEGRPYVRFEPQDGYFEGTEINRMNRMGIENCLRIIEWRESHFDNYVRKCITDVAQNIANLSSWGKPIYGHYTLRLLGVDIYKIYEEKHELEVEVLGITVNKETSDEDRETLVQRIYEHYGYEGSYKDVYASPFVQENSFGKIYEAAKDRGRKTLQQLIANFRKGKKENIQSKKKSSAEERWRGE